MCWNLGLPLFICNLLYQKLCAQTESVATTALPAYAGQAGGHVLAATAWISPFCLTPTIEARADST